MAILDWATGDAFGFAIPAHGAALAAAGSTFLTQAFHASGALPADNSVTSVALRLCAGGSTGQKFLLDVAYARADAALHTDLFVKFSRDFDDPLRDRGKDQLEREVQLALLSREPGFPIRVPTCYFADYEHATGTGLLITQRIPFGTEGLEPLSSKCLDYQLPDPVEHYRAIVTALARIAGTHRAGKFPASVATTFAFDAAAAADALRLRYSPAQLASRVERLAAFIDRYPRLVPAALRDPAFLARLADEIPRVAARQEAIAEWLHADPDYIALVHWNANIDNAWFWRDADGELACGLLDWGGVNQLPLGQALWGALSGAETTLWETQLDQLLARFIAEFRACGGPALTAAHLKSQLVLVTCLLGLNWLLDGPAVVQTQAPDLPADADRLHPAIAENETARSVLQMMTNFLTAWQLHPIATMATELAPESR